VLQFNEHAWQYLIVALLFVWVFTYTSFKSLHRNTRLIFIVSIQYKFGCSSYIIHHNMQLLQTPNALFICLFFSHYNLLLFNRWSLSGQDVCFACKLNLILGTTVGLHFKTIIFDSGLARTSERERENGNYCEGCWTYYISARWEDIGKLLRDTTTNRQTSLLLIAISNANSKFNAASAHGRAGSSEFAHVY